MGIQTTRVITRENAEKLLLKKLTEQLFLISKLSDEELEDSIDEQFYNYQIIN